MLRDCALLSLALTALSGLQVTYAQARVQLFDKSQARPSTQTLLRVQNDLVAVQVRATNDTSSTGEITHAGVFNIGTAANLPLLFKFPDAPFSSHVNLRVDNTFYSNDPRRTNSNVLPLTSARVVGDSTIECTYQAGPIAVMQRLSPQRFSATTGAILIEYVLHNNDRTNNHQVGVLLELDTFVHGNDQAPVLTNFGYSRSEQKFIAPQMPDFLQAFQISNPADSTGLVAQGTLLGYNAVRPDQLIIGDWSRLSTVQWDYAVPDNPPRYDDSAFILRWNEQNLAPNQDRTIATYFGLGDVTTKRDPASGLTLHLTALRNLRAVQGQLTPNPFEINLLVFNRTNPSISSAQATLLLPASLALASGDFATKLLAPSNLNTIINNGTASWTVVAQCPPTALEAPIHVQVAGLVGASSVHAEVTRPLFLPSCIESQPAFSIVTEPKLRSVIPGGYAIFKVFLVPFFGFNQAVQLSIFPATPGIMASFSNSTILAGDTVSLNLQVNHDVFAGDYRFVIGGAAGALASSDSVTLRVVAADLAPPYLTNFDPARGAAEVRLQATVSVDLLDDLAGVDSASVKLSIAGAAVQAALTRVENGYHLRYAPAERWRDNHRVEVKIEAQDLSSPPNLLPAEVYSFTTLRDSLPPRALNFSPAPFAENVSPRADIVMQVEDELTGVDFQSLRLQINGIAVTPDSFSITNGFALRYRLAGDALGNDTVRVAISAQDLASQPNAFSLSYYFIIGQDHLPPFIAARSPSPGVRGAPVDAEVSVAIVDLQSGVDLQTLAMTINGQNVQPLILPDDQGSVTLRYKPSSLWLYNSVVRVSVYAQDLAFPPNVMPPDTFSFAILEDREPPSLLNFLPPDSAMQVPTNTAISFNLQDEIAGVDRAGLEIRVNGAGILPEISGSPRLLAVRYKPGQEFSLNQSVEVRVRGRDLSNPPNEMPEKTFRFTTAPARPDLLAGDLQQTESFTLGRPVKVIGKIQASFAEVNQSFQIEFYTDGESHGDTTITALAAGQEIGVETSLRFNTPGTHVAEMVVDANNAIVEVDENNNRSQLVVNLNEDLSNKLIVRPNPFTPNSDGYNDIVEFNFAGLNLDSPTLHIFDVNGIPVWINEPQSGEVYSWNGRDDNDRELQPGVYIYTLRDKGQNVASGHVVIAR